MKINEEFQMRCVRGLLAAAREAAPVSIQLADGFVATAANMLAGVVKRQADEAPALLLPRRSRNRTAS